MNTAIDEELVHIALPEWQSVGPGDRIELQGLGFESYPAARSLAAKLSQAGQIEVLEMAQGLQLQARSYVGRVRLGPVEITIRPKLPGDHLLTLFRYAYGLRNLEMISASAYDTDSSQAFQELLVLQLVGEAEELLARGLHRDYRRVQEHLTSPKGQIDFGAFVGAGGLVQTTLPCIHHLRLQDSPLNRMLLAGLALGARLTRDIALRVRIRRSMQQLSDSVAMVVPTWVAMQEALHTLDRRTSTYRPALTLIQLLMEGAGIDLQASSGVQLSGFLFDMNRFFQALLSHFLQENLTSVTIQDEYRLQGMMAYEAGYNPRRRQPPSPRPDFVLLQGKRIVAILDAKYRDLWERTLPREMLYQLSIYALSQSEAMTAAILYPTVDSAATEARIVIRNPVNGSSKGNVALRPVDLNRLVDLVMAPNTAATKRERTAYATYLAYG